MTGYRALGSPCSSGPQADDTVATRFRYCARDTPCRQPSLRPGSFPPRPPPPFITGLFVRYRYYGPVRLLTCSPTASSPRLPFAARNRRGDAGQMRSPRFRRVPFRRDLISDPGRAAAPRVTVPPVLPSTVLNGSASALSSISWLYTHPIGSLCTLHERRHRRPRNTRYRAVRYDPTRAGLAPAGPRQLAWRTNTADHITASSGPRSIEPAAAQRGDRSPAYQNPTHNAADARVSGQPRRRRQRMEATKSQAPALSLEASKSLASRRQRPSNAKVRSTTQRRGNRMKPLAASGRRTISNVQQPLAANSPSSFGPA